MRRFAPVLVLLVLAPLTAEVLLGDIPLSLLFTFPVLMGLYGTAALLIRELVRRRQLGWSRIVVLGLAFGIIAEGLVFESLFNPHFPGAGSFAVYGRWLGINWFWAEYVLGWHTIWSISLPILLTELLFPARQSEPWVGRVGLWIAGIVFVLTCGLEMLIYHNLSAGFHASPLLLIGAACLAGALILLALLLPRRVATRQTTVTASLSPWLAGLLAFICGGIWLGIHEIISPTFIIPAPLLVLLLALLALAVTLILRYWSAPGHQWEKRHRLALASGTLLAGMCVGLIVVQDGKVFDLIGQICLGVLTAVLLALFNWQLSRSKFSSEKAA